VIDPAVGAEVAATVQALWDIEQIKQLKARYFRLLDMRQWDDWSQLFTEDCEFRTRPDPDEVQTGREEFAAFVRSIITPGVSVHHGHMPEITITGADTASGIWSMFDYVQTDPDAVAQFALQGYGHYVETYRRTVQGWRISSLQLTRLRVDEVG
jgi:hypothetical protein